MTKNININVKSVSINLEDSAKAVVRLEGPVKKIVYSRYIADHGVTLDTVAEHVQALAALAIELDEVDPEDKVALKALKTKFRNGLNSNLGKVSPSKKKNVGTENLLTGHGIEALMGKTDAEIIHMVMTELVNRTADSK